ncbi:MAG: NTP transferase domain-containing protein, partial [Acidobacteria bacterium]|nr:NTP transferase domain-containing protein [Acidobacteriota bacterium]
MRVIGAVLCGGRSSRMGRDKALVPHRGIPMVRSVADALTAGGCSEVVAVGGDTVGLGTLGFDVTPDLHPGEGPLGGV